MLVACEGGTIVPMVTPYLTMQGVFSCSVTTTENSTVGYILVSLTVLPSGFFHLLLL